MVTLSVSEYLHSSLTLVLISLAEHRKNVKFVQGDVNKLVLEANSQDVVFSCWLLMYLSDEEVRDWALN